MDKTQGRARWLWAALAIGAITLGAFALPKEARCFGCWRTRCTVDLGCGLDCYCARGGPGTSGVCLTRP